MFAYCNNCPINLSDSSGNRPVSELEKYGGVSLNVPARAKVKYDVPLYDQGDYKLCWAFCMLMIESFKAGIEYSKDEATDQAITLAKSVNGECWDRANNPPNAGEGMRLSSIEHLYKLLRSEGPVYAKYSRKDENGGKAYHLVVVTGVDLENNTVYINNPWNYSGCQQFEIFMKDLAWKNKTTYDYDLYQIYPANN